MSLRPPGVIAKINASFTRPADTTQYAAGDAITNSTSAPTALTIPNCARVTVGSGTILNAMLIDSANQSTKLSAECWLFTSAPTADNDNAVFTPTDAECANLVCIIPFNTSYVGDATAGAGGNVVFQSEIINRGFTLPAGKDLYALLVARNAYTPVSDEVFTIRLTILQD